MSTKRIEVFDTTLRDGEQGIGNLMTIEQKLSLLILLDQLNFDVIELGYPASSMQEQDFFRSASKLSTIHAKICAFSRPTLSDLGITVSCLKGFSASQVQLLGVGSEIHLNHKRRISSAQAKIELLESVLFLRKSGVDDISVILEDATRASFSYLKTMLEAVGEHVSTITFADTVGYATPTLIKKLIMFAKKTLPTTCKIGIHCHNDLGLATANTLAAVCAGADIMQTTIGGVGERAGNCALEEIAAILYYKENDYQTSTAIPLKKINAAVRTLYRTLGKPMPDNKPIVGRHVYSTAAGIHQDGIQKNPITYEYVNPKDFDRHRTFVLNRLSSKKL